MDLVAFILGTLGTVIWATGRLRGWEGIFWLASSGLWIIHAWLTDQHPLLARDVLGLTLYAAACWRVFVAPKLQRNVARDSR